MTSRNNNKWTVNELLALQREHELLEMDIFDIALKHKRTPRAILYKLEDEGIINTWSEAHGYDKYCNENFGGELNNSLASLYNSNSNVFEKMNNTNTNINNNINNRISYLESAVSGIKYTLDAIASKLLPKQIRACAV